VTYDVRDGYVASAPELRQPIVALMSLDGLRRKIEIALLPDDVRIVLQLDGWYPSANKEWARLGSALPAHR
jgi:hypothetical protein